MGYILRIGKSQQSIGVVPQSISGDVEAKSML